MGGSESVDKRREVRGKVYIMLTKSGFISEEIIEGLLCVQLEEPFQGHLLMVTMEGAEETRYTYTYTTGSGKYRRTRTKHVHGWNMFLNYSLPIYDFSSVNNNNFVLQPGQWQIPFRLGVAQTLPSSMFFQKSQSVQCNVRYRLVGSLISSDPQVKPLMGLQDIVVAQIPQVPRAPISLNSISSPTICCCCSDGTLNLAATLNKQAFSPTEDIQVALNCDRTQYSRNIEAFQVEIVGIITMRAPSTERTHLERITLQTIRLPIRGKNIIDDIVTLKVPQNSQLSSKTSLITLNFFVSISPVVVSMCFVKNPPLLIPIIIGPANPSELVYQYPPNFTIPSIQSPAVLPQWNPQALEQRQFSQEESTTIQQIQLQFQQEQQQIYLQQAEIFNNTQQALLDQETDKPKDKPVYL